MHVKQRLRASWSGAYLVSTQHRTGRMGSWLRHVILPLCYHQHCAFDVSFERKSGLIFNAHMAAGVGLSEALAAADAAALVAAASAALGPAAWGARVGVSCLRPHRLCVTLRSVAIHA